MTRSLAARVPALLALLCAACGSSSLVIGGDPDGEALSGGSGSTLAETGGGAGLGGSASFATGGAAAAGGSASTPAPLLGGDYPWVVWAQGRGYEQACAPDGDVWGASCWNHTSEGSVACEADGEPFCNACNCMISCATGSDCPAGPAGEPAVCLATGELGLCFVSCEDGAPCPKGMTCSVHPELGNSVCVWFDRDGQSMPAPR